MAAYSAQIIDDHWSEILKTECDDDLQICHFFAQDLVYDTISYAHHEHIWESYFDSFTKTLLDSIHWRDILLKLVDANSIIGFYIFFFYTEGLVNINQGTLPDHISRVGKILFYFLQAQNLNLYDKVYSFESENISYHPVTLTTEQLIKAFKVSTFL